MTNRRDIISDDFDESAHFAPETPNNNPLLRFFRTPGTHVKLPTRGAFLPEGTMKATLSGDIPVLPMRGADEMLLKSPDALMSGHAIEELLKSCVPSITSARKISVPDLDVLFLAIRSATYGNIMTLRPKCPKCEEVGEYECKLSSFLDTMVTIPAQNPVILSEEITAFVRPYTLEMATRAALVSFEETRKLQALEIEEASPQTKTEQMNKSLDRINALKGDMLCQCIERVEIPGAQVRNTKHIHEWLQNTSKIWYDKIEKAIEAVNTGGIDKTMVVTCQACEHEYKQEVELNASTFFGESSSE